jgi:branched-chain amino acid transport system substrate-binding protein
MIKILKFLLKKSSFFYSTLIFLIVFPGVSTPFPVKAQNSKPFNLAAIFSLTGQGASSNRSSVLGTRLAVNEINNNGGLLGHNLHLILLDNLSTPIGSSLAANEAVKAGVIGIIGAQWSSHSIAVANVAQRNKIPMISNFSTYPGLTDIGNYIFRVCYTDRFQGEVMARFARRELHASTAAVFVDLTSDYSLKLSDIFKNDFTKLGGKIVGEIEYKAKNANYNDLVVKAKADPSDVIFLSGHEESGMIAWKLQSAGIKSILLGGDGWSVESFFENGGRHLKTGYFCSHWSEDSDRKQTRDFVAKYKQLDDFGAGAALAYDAVMVLAQAIRTAGTTDGTKVAKTLLQMKPYEGVTGSIKFDKNGDPEKRAVIMKISNGKPEFLESLAP